MEATLQHQTAAFIARLSAASTADPSHQTNPNKSNDHHVVNSKYSHINWTILPGRSPEKLEMQSSEYRPRVDFVSSPSVMLYAGRGFNLCSLVCFTVKHIPKKIGIYFFSRKIRRRKE